MRHFEAFPELVETLESRGKDEQVAKVKRANQIIHPVAVEQEKPLGLGHAVGLAEEVLEEDEDSFAVMLPDDIVLPATVMADMARVRAALGGSVLCAFEVPREQTYNYGVFDVEDTDAPGVKKVVGMVEKPAVEDAPSNLVATGRYLWTARSLMPCAVLSRARAASCSLLTPSSSSLRKASPSTW